MRLDRFLAESGLGSRKEVKKMVKSKRVSVNGAVVSKDDLQIDELHDEILADGIKVAYEPFVYFLLNKPQGVISATEDAHHQTVLDLIDEKRRGLFPVGRLDIDTEGLLLITNDGALAHELLSPKKHVEKGYEVTLRDPIQESDIALLEAGICFQGETFKPARVEILSEKQIHLFITEGKYHQVKRMMQACGNEVVYLKRFSMGPLFLDEHLKSGKARRLENEELRALKDFINKGRA